jgi:hypothetical protein
MRNRTRTFGAVVGALASLALGSATDERSAEACSCAGPNLTFLGPKGRDVPLNTHVRIDVPTGTSGTYVLRTHPGSGAPAIVASTKTSVYSVGTSGLETVDLAPLAPLAPSTRYEVVVVRPGTHPPNTVVGTFVTGTGTDTTPPRFSNLGKVRTRLNLGHVGGGMCSIRGPWLTVSDYVAEDPGRPDAHLAFLVWGPDAKGKVDTSATPSALVEPFRGEIAIGQTSLCDPRSFPLPGSRITLAIATVDEAGNRSAPKTFQADLTRPTP